MFEAHGMSYDDINEDYLSYSEAIDQIKNGMIDAAFVTSGFEMPLLLTYKQRMMLSLFQLKERNG